MSPWWLLVFIAMLFTSGTVAWCLAQSRVTARQREWRVRSGLLSPVDAATAPGVVQRRNPVDPIHPPQEAPQ
jgi:hypothetical protein